MFNLTHFFRKDANLLFFFYKTSLYLPSTTPHTHLPKTKWYLFFFYIQIKIYKGCALPKIQSLRITSTFCRWSEWNLSLRLYRTHSCSWGKLPEFTASEQLLEQLFPKSRPRKQDKTVPASGTVPSFWSSFHVPINDPKGDGDNAEQTLPKDVVESSEPLPAGSMVRAHRVLIRLWARLLAPRLWPPNVDWLKDRERMTGRRQLPVLNIS